MPIDFNVYLGSTGVVEGMEKAFWRLPLRLGAFAGNPKDAFGSHFWPAKKDFPQRR
jgi:hypothetical protein